MKRFMLLLTLFAAVGLALPGVLTAQKPKTTLDKLPTLLGSTNAGTEFYFSFPPCYEEESAGGDNSVRVYVASGVRQEVRLEVVSQGFVMMKVVPANDVVEFRIPSSVGQPFLKAGRNPAPPERVLPGAGVHIKSRAPIIAYGMTRYQYTSDGFLAVPVSGLGEEYIVAAWPQYTAVGAGYQLASLTTVTAAYDDTQMTFEMGGTSSSQTTGGLRPGQKATFKMKKGDVVCFSGNGDLQDVSGSYIVADKPVGVVSGNQCANVPAGVPWCDFTSEMELPIKTWGTEYHVTPIAKRANMPVIRVFAKEKNTTIYKDGLQWRTINRASRVQNSGYLELRPPLDETTNKTGPVVVSADKPIYVMLYNTGQADDNVPSDPFQYILTPLEQYQTEIVFATPGAKGGSLPFTEHYVNFVFELTSALSIPDDCEFATVVNGKFAWKRVSTVFGSSPGQIFKVPVRGKNYACKLLTLPGDGVYRLRAKSPFAAYAYGFSSYDSYGFPTSVALGDLTKKDTVAPELKWEQKCDGTVEGATAEDLPKDPNVRSNLALIYMDPDEAESYNYTFSYDKDNKFVAGQTIKTDWKLTVDDLTKDAQASLYFVDRAGNETKLVVKYSAYSVTLLPSPIDFGVLKPGATATKKVTLKNTGTKEVTITKFELKDKGQGFTLLNVTLPMTLAAGESRDVDVQFTNAVEGNYKDSIGVGNDCLFKNLVAVYGEVIAPVIEVSDIDYQTILETATKTDKIYVRNPGKVDLVITGWSGPTNTTVFKTVNWPTDLATNPKVLLPGGQWDLDVMFDPDAVNTFTDKITFTNDAKNNGTYRDNVANLIGRAVLPQLTVTNYDWQKRRVKSRRTPNAAFTATITLENLGSAPITVIKATSPASAVFGYTVADFAGNQFQPGEKKDFTVTFDPDAVGPHSLDITFETSDPSITPVSQLRGIGIVPKIMTKDVDFGNTLVKTGAANQRQFEITCEQYQWEDAVTITDFAAATVGTVGTSGAGAYGTEGFRFDVGTMLPGGKLVINPGETKTFNADFLAQQVAPVSEPLTTKSDAETEATSVWSGFGVDPFVPVRDMVSVGGAVGPICVGSDGVITASIRNLGNVDMDLNDLTLDDPQFTLISPLRSALPVTLKPGESQQVQVRYRPTATGTHGAGLTFTNSARDTVVRLTGSAQSFERETGVTLTTTSSGNNAPTSVKIGESLFAHVGLKPGTPIGLAGVTTVRVKLMYDKTLLEYRDVVGIANHTITGKTPGDGFVEFTATSAGTIDAETVFAKAEFRAMLPQTKADVSQDKIAFTLETEVLGNSCAKFNPTGAELVVDPTCGYSFRRIVGSGKAYSLSAIGPNPLIGNEMEVRMTLGMSAGTELAIYSTTGEVVKRVTLGTLDAGEYEVKVDVSDVGSGSYTVRLRSGLFSAERQVVITK